MTKLLYQILITGFLSFFIVDWINRRKKSSKRPQKQSDQEAHASLLAIAEQSADRIKAGIQQQVNARSLGSIKLKLVVDFDQHSYCFSCSTGGNSLAYNPRYIMKMPADQFDHLIKTICHVYAENSK
jgi:hypothetical protein